MKTTGLFLPLLLAIVPPAVAQSSPPVEPPAATPPAESTVAQAPGEAPAKLSPEVSRILTANLPKFSPLAQAKPAAANPDVLELPKVTVTQKKRPRLGEDVMMTDKAFNEMLAKQRLSSFDRNFLNKYTLPLFGMPAALRAREDYEREKKAQFLSDIETIARATEAVDPEQAKALRDAAARP